MIGGKPLLAYTILAALKSRLVNLVAVSTESKQIAEIAQEYGASVINRPPKLAKSPIPVPMVVHHAVRYTKSKLNYNPKSVIVLQPTSPLRTSEDIDHAIMKYYDNHCDSMISVTEIECPLKWMYKIDNEELRPILSSNHFGQVYKLNGAIYIAKVNTILKSFSLWGKKTCAYVMPRQKSIDVDVELDFDIAEMLLKKQGVIECQKIVTQ